MSLPAFAELLERLVFTPGRNAKLALLGQWFAQQPDPDRGIGLAALTGDLAFTAAKPGMIRELVASRTDPELWRLSYDYVGDLAETVALIWQPRAGVNAPPPTLAEVVEALETTPKAEIPALIAGWLDTLDAGARLALIKLVTGGLRVGVSARLARVALAEWSGQPVEEIEEVWHGVAPPYAPLFHWLDGQGAAPRPARRADLPPADAGPSAGSRRPRRAARAGSGAPNGNGTASACRSPPGRAAARIFSRGGEDISAAFPEILDALDFHAVLDGELLVVARRRGRPLRRSAATAEPQERHGEDAARPPRRRAPLRPAVRRRRRICARCPSTPAARGWKPGTRARAAAHGPLRPGALRRASTRWRASATAPAPRRSRG